MSSSEHKYSLKLNAAINGLAKTKSKCLKKKFMWGTSLGVQWLRLCTPNAGVLNSIPGQGTRSYMPQLNSLHVAAKELEYHNED